MLREDSLWVMPTARLIKVDDLKLTIHVTGFKVIVS